MSLIEIIIDTREQRPWHFPEGFVRASFGTLKTGDYALKGDSEFAIERKELSDYVQSVTRNWTRFHKEIVRMQYWRVKLIVVEGNFEDYLYKTMQGEIVPPSHGHYKITPQFVLKQTAILINMGVCVLFAGNAGNAAALALAVFRERFNEINNKS
jgi:hypothetical protein